MPPAKILIVEDEAAIAMELESRLLELGYAVIGPVSSGQAALRLAQTTSPDLALMDIHLQGARDGIATAAELRTRFQLPVVYLTANTDALTLENARRTEPIGFLTKPFRERELHATIEMGLYKHRADQGLRLQQVLALALSTASDLEQMLQQIVRQLGEFMHWTVGEAWLPTAAHDQLELRALWHEDDGQNWEAYRAVSQTMRFIPGQGLIGQAWASQQPAWVVDVLHHPQCLRVNVAQPLGLHNALVMPVVDQGQVAAVFVFMARDAHPPDDHQLNLLTTISAQLGQAMMRRRAEEALRALNLELEARVQQRTAELAAANAELRQFAYIAAHDLQEPLRPIISFTQLLANRYRGQLDADAEEFMGYIVTGAVRMKQLVSALLRYAELGQGEFEPQPTDSRTALEEALRNLETLRTESGAVITMDELPVVHAHALQLRQVFQDLLQNALKFNQSRPPRIHISAHRRAADAPAQWVFSVRDNGLGIEPQYFDRIFEIFKRLHSRDEYPGAGIGLALCKRIIERHGGQIWVESALGAGATFYFTLPGNTLPSP